MADVTFLLRHSNSMGDISPGDGGRLRREDAHLPSHGERKEPMTSVLLNTIYS